MIIKKFLLSGFETNCYLVYDEETKDAYIVDPGASCPALCEYVEKEGLKPSYIILTHGHGDHTGGIPYVKERYPEIKLLANKAESKLLYDRKASFGKGGITPDVFVKDGDELEVGPMKLKFIACPGHTPGGMSIYTENVLFSGDTLFRASVGRTDFPGGDFDALLDSITNKLFKLPEDTLVLPGHMEETSIAFEKRYNPFV